MIAFLDVETKQFHRWHHFFWIVFFFESLSTVTCWEIMHKMLFHGLHSYNTLTIIKLDDCPKIWYILWVLQEPNSIGWDRNRNYPTNLLILFFYNKTCKHNLCCLVRNAYPHRCWSPYLDSPRCNLKGITPKNNKVLLFLSMHIRIIRHFCPTCL